jgi:hypothetical protein
MSAPDITLSSSQIRKRGLRLLTIGGVVFGGILYLMYWLSAHSYHFQFAVVGPSLPFVFFCVGFIEALTGSPYLRLAQRWMALRGWQRGVLGTFIVLAALVFILLGVTFCILTFT